MSFGRQITFRPVATSDLPMLTEWLARPPVVEWWGAPQSLAEVEDDYAPAIAGTVRPMKSTRQTVARW